MMFAVAALTLAGLNSSLKLCLGRDKRDLDEKIDTTLLSSHLNTLCVFVPPDIAKSTMAVLFCGGFGFWYFYLLQPLPM